VAFEAQVVCPMTVPGGAVASVFSYHLLNPNPFQHDEIDFEFSSKHWRGAGEAINTNIYVASNAGIDQVVGTTVDFSQPITFRIEWTRSGITWYVNRSPVRRNTNVPQSDMSLTFNFWVPDDTWGWAYDANLQPSGAPGTNWVYQVNWAKVYAMAG
jgi:beta-glucanase (GH16 family)